MALAANHGIFERRWWYLGAWKCVHNPEARQLSVEFLGIRGADEPPPELGARYAAIAVELNGQAYKEKIWV
ncbi:hypothetical protein MRX96_040347 [Rhipicephalus microplus]